jgi:hypothetical protein
MKQAAHSGIVRVEKNANNPYKTLNTTFANDERLSWAARGMMAYLLSKPDNWRVVTKDLIAQTKAGRDAVHTILRELEACGYLTRNRYQSVGGKFVWESVVYETPRETEPTPQVDEPETDEPCTANPYTDEPPTVEPETDKPYIYLLSRETNKDLNKKGEKSGALPRSPSPPKQRPLGLAPTRNADPDGTLDHPMVQLVVTVLGYKPTVLQRGSIVDTVKNETCWRDVLTYWALNQYRVDSVGKMIERYREQIGKIQPSTVNPDEPDEELYYPNGELNLEAFQRYEQKRGQVNHATYRKAHS